MSKFESISRRDLLIGAGALASIAGTGAMAEVVHNHDHEMKTTDQELINATFDCLKKGQACVAHCLESFKSGDTSLADCADSVQEMLAICDATAKLASFKSSHLKALAAVCADVCGDCEKECRKHADKHISCQACADACADCIKECEKIV